MTHRTMSKRSYHGATSRSWVQRKEMYYLMTHSTHFHFQLYIYIWYMVKNYVLLPLHGLLFRTSTKGSQTGFQIHQLWSTGCRENYNSSMCLSCRGARCSSVVRAFAHGVMGNRIDPSWGGPIELFLFPASAPRLV